MKKLSLILIILVFTCFLAFSDTEEQEEIDYLLFMPNSASQFVNQEEAMLQLDSIAAYLSGRNLSPGQISIYGYSAYVMNDIDGEELSRERAQFVTRELQSRGLRSELFAQILGLGEVDLWGSNEDEDERSPNRRVRILIDGVIITPAVIASPPPPTVTPPPPTPAPAAPVTQDESSGFPWWLLLIPLLLLLIFFLAKRSKKKEAPPEKETAPIKEEPVPEPAAVPAAAPIVPVPITFTYANLEEEIRNCAYGFYLGRNGQDENPYEDWCKAVIVVCARYSSKGYETYTEDGTWMAKREKK